MNVVDLFRPTSSAPRPDVSYLLSPDSDRSKLLAALVREQRPMAEIAGFFHVETRTAGYLLAIRNRIFIEETNPMSPLDQAAALVDSTLTAYDAAAVTKATNDAALATAQAQQANSDTAFTAAHTAFVNAVQALLTLATAPPVAPVASP